MVETESMVVCEGGITFTVDVTGPAPMETVIVQGDYDDVVFTACVDEGGEPYIDIEQR